MEYRASLDELPPGDMLDQMTSGVDQYLEEIGHALYDLGSEVPDASAAPRPAARPAPPRLPPPPKRDSDGRNGAWWRQPRVAVGVIMLVIAVAVLVVTLATGTTSTPTSTARPFVSVTVSAQPVPTSQPCAIGLSYRVQVLDAGSYESSPITLTLSGKAAPGRVSPQSKTHAGSGIVQAVYSTSEPGSSWGAVGSGCGGVPSLWTVSKVELGPCSLSTPSDVPKAAVCPKQ